MVRDLWPVVLCSPSEPPPPPPPEPEWSEVASEVNHLTDDTFKSFIKRKKHTLVMFYAPCEWDRSLIMVIDLEVPLYVLILLHKCLAGNGIIAWNWLGFMGNLWLMWMCWLLRYFWCLSLHCWDIMHFASKVFPCYNRTRYTVVCDIMQSSAAS